MALTIPPKPGDIRPDRPPPGYRASLVSFNHERRIITPRLQLAHTNGAGGQGSIESSKAWAERRTVNGVATTLPHFQVDRDGDAAMLLELNRQPIANAKANPFSIAYETADTGYKADPQISGFTEPQLQMMANGFAYCAVLFKIPLAYPATWNGSGSASHTEPFGYPYWTSYNGKICPGTAKKQQVRDVVIPFARAIVASWLGVTPIPKPPPESNKPIEGTPSEGAMLMTPLVLKFGGTSTANWSGYVSRDGGWTAQSINDMHHARLLVALGAIDAKTGKRVTDPNWADVSHTANVTELKAWLTPVAV